MKETGKIITYLSITLLLAVIILPLSIAYAKNPTEWLFGGKQDTLKIETWTDHAPMKFKQKADFSGTEFSKEADFSGVEFPKEAVFLRAKFSKKANFLGAEFSKEAVFTVADFSNVADFSGAEFSNLAYFAGAQFSNLAEFLGAQFSNVADFSKVHFCNVADFSGVQFTKKVDFLWAEFSKEADFSGAQFSNVANFSGAQFCNVADLSRAQFSNVVNFENSVFDTTLNIARTRFEKGVDLRRTNISKAEVLYDHHTFFPSGTLKVYWSQLEGHLSLHDSSCPSYRKWKSIKAHIKKLDSLQQHLPDILAAKRESIGIELNTAKADFDSLTTLLNKERYDLTEIFYHRLRDNYLAQNDRSSADAVMFELASKRAESLKEPLWRLYGLFMGWGYKPLRFVISVFLLIVIPFAILWYMRFYHRVLPIFSEISHPQQIQIRNKPLLKKTILKYIHFHISNHPIVSGSVNLPARIMHVLHFSTAVLLSIRFKKEWINMTDRAFLSWVIAEWVLGIALYITFAILVKSYEFGYVKGLLGF